MSAYRDLDALLERAEQVVNAASCSSVATVAGAKGETEAPNRGPTATNRPANSTPPVATLATLLQSADLEALSRPWSVAEWAYRFHERVGFLHHDCGLSRHDAEQRALDELQSHWRALHPLTPSKPEAGCVQCGTVGGVNLVPVLAGKKDHAWVHSRCWAVLDQARRSEALAALRKLIPSLPDNAA